MRIYTKIELRWDGEAYVEVSSESYEYKGEVAQLGGGGGTETVKTEPWEKQQPYLEDLFQQGQDYFQRGAPDTSAARARTGEAVAGYGRAAEGVESYLSPIREASQRFASGSLLDPASNPAFAKYLDLSNQAITKQYTEGFLPQLTGGAVAAGNIGSSRQGVAEGIGAGKTLDAIQRQTSGLTSQAYGQGLQATMQAQALAPAFAQSFGLAPGFQATGAGLQYGLDTEADEAAKARLLAYQQIIGGNYGGTQTSPAQQSGGLSGALGGAATGAYLGSVIPGLGTGLGAGLGGLAGFFS